VVRQHIGWQLRQRDGANHLGDRDRAAEISRHNRIRSGRKRLERSQRSKDSRSAAGTHADGEGEIGDVEIGGGEVGENGGEEAVGDTDIQVGDRGADLDGDGFLEVIGNRYATRTGLSSFILTAKDGKPIRSLKYPLLPLVGDVDRLGILYRDPYNRATQLRELESHDWEESSVMLASARSQRADDDHDLWSLD